jgi:hypothetical protein
MLNLVAQFIMIYIMVLIWKLPKIPTIQKPYNRSFLVPMACFVDALRPEKFFIHSYLKFTLGKIVQHVPTIGKNLVSASLLLRDGFKVVLESNK